jgi:hypothetical protein
MLVCRQAARLISDSCQRPLNWGERIALRVHLLACEACRNFKRQVRLLREAARRLPDAPVEAFADLRLPEAARQRIIRALAERPPD